MRALSGAAAAAVDAVVTSPGHLIALAFSDPVPVVRWSDIGQVTLSDMTTWAAVDMKVSRVSVAGDSVPQQFAIQLANLDSSIGALLLANDLSNVPVHVIGFDRAAINLADIIPLGVFNITSARIGIDTAQLTCSPIYYTAPFRRVDAPNGFRFATPAGRQIVWGRESLILDRLNDWYYL